MKNNLLTLPPDLYSRNYIISEGIRAYKEKKGLTSVSVLDIGGRNGKMKFFLSRKDTLTLLDIREGSEPNLIIGDATKMNFFENNSFDVVTSGDVFEHIPVEKRKKFLSECFRVSKDLVIVAGPDNNKRNVLAEKSLHQFYKQIHEGKHHLWLDEHQTNGLPDWRMVSRFGTKSRKYTQNIASNNIDSWFLFQMFVFLAYKHSFSAKIVNRFYTSYNKAFLKIENPNFSFYRNISFFSNIKLGKFFEYKYDSAKKSRIWSDIFITLDEVESDLELKKNTEHNLSEERLNDLIKFQKLSAERLAEIEKIQKIQKEQAKTILDLNKSYSEKFINFLGKKSSKVKTFIHLKQTRGLPYALRESTLFFLNPISQNIQKAIPKFYEKDIMFISGCPGGSMLYRCYIEAEYYKKEGKSCEVFLQDNINIYSLLDNFKTVIFHRVIWTEHLQNILNKIKLQKKEAIFSTDDLVYDPKYLKDMHYYKKMGKDEKSWYENGISRELIEDSYVKKCIVTTKFLKDDLEKRGKIVEIRKNKLSFKTIENSKKAIKWWKKKKAKTKPKDEFWIGYFSGSASHDADFKVIEDVLYSFLKKHESAVFFIGGYLTLNKKFDSLVKKDQVRWIPFVPWQKLPYEIVKMDLNIAPLEIDNPFCQAKSDIKYLEAKAVEVPTIASATEPFVTSIEKKDKNKWGIVAYNGKDWGKGFEAYFKIYINHKED